VKKKNLGLHYSSDDRTIYHNRTVENRRVRYYFVYFAYSYKLAVVFNRSMLYFTSNPEEKNYTVVLKFKKINVWYFQKFMFSYIFIIFCHVSSTLTLIQAICEHVTEHYYFSNYNRNYFIITKCSVYHVFVYKK